MEYIDGRMGEGWRTVECCSGSCERWGTRGATRSWRSMCGHGGEAASPRRQCALTLRPGNGVEPVRDGGIFLVSGANSPGNGLLRAGAEPLGGRASETAGGANLHSFVAVSHHAIRAEMFPGDVDGTRPPLLCRLEMPAPPAARTCPTRIDIGGVGSALPQVQYRLDQVREAQRRKRSKGGNPVTVLSGVLTGPEAGRRTPQLESLGLRLRSTAACLPETCPRVFAHQAHR